MKVSFIEHSCFLVEGESCYLLFDYYKGRLPKLDPSKALYIFSSHSHPDHFDPAVFDAVCPGQKVTLFLSKDIFKSRVPEPLLENTVFVKPRASYEAQGIRVSTLKSTDTGVAFLAECEGKLIYHAGDLNCWVWDGAPGYQNRLMTEAYKNELSLLIGKDIYIAFVPLDPRLGENFHLGMKYFLESTHAEHIFPMHMWGDYSVIRRFSQMPEFSGVRLMDADMPGKLFEL